MFLIFGGERYYPSGGGYDYIDMDSSLKNACKKAENFIEKKGRSRSGEEGNCTFLIDIEWTHVFNSESGEIVARFGSMPYGDGSLILGIEERK